MGAASSNIGGAGASRERGGRSGLAPDDRLALLQTQLAELTNRIAMVDAVPAAPVDRETPAGTDHEMDAKAKAICLRLLAVAPRPRAGLWQALRRREIPDEVSERVLDRLTEVGLINDAEYAASFVRTKHRDRGLARTALRGELRRLGLEDDLTSAAVETVDGDAEEKRALALVAKHLGSMTLLEPQVAQRRLLAMLARRGYSADLSVAVVHRVVDAYFRASSMTEGEGS